ncbi:hypothetical protein NGB36_30040 [Streptomyces sp. RB6PN25]|uniref:DUF8094 domain-containing protein n=1 Tax=Streptomyces humicola TaxID=2953240 RepID=A0ABT1Q453_9ACTN|nr:hypothetical protein [Streptomyces humicola]MCQ4084704.1 hypothetical protein [Streptomyces humicola]
MTAPPPLARLTVRLRQQRRLRRGVLLLAASALLVPSAAGCVTVDGAEALIPSVKQSDAQQVLDHFAQVNNEANAQLDASLNDGIETGALGAIDQAGIKARHINDPAGNPGYQQLRFSDAHFLIPQQRGWPKWFIADTASNRDTERWLMVFTRNSSSEPWRAEYLTTLPQSQLPQFATDASGYVEPVPVSGSGLVVQPDQLSAQYAAYLQQGDKGSAVFADGNDTSGLRQQRRTQYAPTSQLVTQFADEPADPSQYPPVALRLTDGSALVFFTTHHVMRQTVAQGPVKITDPDINALMQGTPNKSVTFNKIAEELVRVPAAASGGKVVFVNRIEGLVSVTGQ